MAPADQWWCINGEELISAMRRAHEGEDPDMLYIELVANSTSDNDG